MVKYELIKEIELGGREKWYINKDGSYLSGSLSYREQEVLEMFNRIVKTNGKEATTIVVDTFIKQDSHDTTS